MTNIPFKPLSERMLEEPFWLGLITVTAVLLLIGVCYFLKKHLPERLEKFLVDDPEAAGKLVGDRRGYDGGGGGGRYYHHYTPQVSTEQLIQNVEGTSKWIPPVLKNQGRLLDHEEKNVRALSPVVGNRLKKRTACWALYVGLSDAHVRPKRDFSGVSLAV